MNSLEIRQILEYLPHRFPMLLVDRVIDYEVGVRIQALKNVTMNEPFFPGHYPHSPVMPGVLVVEALAQAAAILSFLTLNQKPDAKSMYYFVGIDAARFKKPVLPGDQLLLDVAIMRMSRGVCKYAGRASVDGSRVAEAELMCTYRIAGAAEAT